MVTATRTRPAPSLEGGPGVPKRGGEKARESLGWLHYVERSGPEGAAWARHYREVEGIDDKSVSALGMLRAGDLRRGRILLDEIDQELRTLEHLEPSIRHVLERWYWGVVAFYHYASGELERAASELRRADEAAVKAVACRRFLLPLANHCHEFRLHLARVERNRHRWDAMWKHLETVREMMEDRLPLCVLQSGERIYLASVIEFFHSLPGGLDGREREHLAGLLDRDRRLGLLDRFRRGILSFPGFVIPCP